MTSVLFPRCVVQVCRMFTFAIVIAAIAGCTPRADTQPEAGTTVPAVTAPAGTTTPATPFQDETTVDVLPAPEEPVEEKAAEEMVVAEVAVVEEQPPEADQPKEEKEKTDNDAEDADKKEFDPTAVVTVQWLPEPIEVPNANAENESDMKAYTEVIPDTDAKFDMVPIHGGKFTMGSPEGEKDRNDDEGPQHEVAVEPFWMGKCEVTWDEYELWGLSIDVQRRELARKTSGKEPTERELLVDAITQPTKPYSDMTFGMGKEDYPVICMTQLAARVYCKWLSAKTGRYYRLPTEAEWEYAARAGTDTAYSFGDDPEKLGDYAWHFENSDDGYHKVGQKKPNPWGLYDMHGNVSEWVLDQYIPDYYKQLAGKATTCPLAVPTTEYPRVTRGGCWDDDPEKLRSAVRTGSSEDWKMQDPQIPKSIWYTTEVYCPGFRIVRPLKTPDAEEAKLYEPDIEVIKEYAEAQAGKE